MRGADQTPGTSEDETPELSIADGPRPRSKLLQRFAVAAAILVLAAAAYAVYRSGSIAPRLAVTRYEADSLAKTLDPAPSAGSQDPLYILILADDRRASETQARTDAMIVARVDPKNKKVILLSISRDTRVPIQGFGTTKINQAHILGGPALAVDTVKRFTGLPINHYVRLDFEGLTELVDVMGGLNIDVDRPINETYREQGIPFVAHIDKGYQRLDSAQTLAYVRSRMFPEVDFVRCLHQRTFLVALAKEALKASPTRQMLILASASDHLRSDMSVGQLLSLARDLRGITEKDVVGRTVPGKFVMIDRVSYILPDEARTKELLDYMRRGEVPPGPVDTSFQ